jgi:2-keto-3-deoxy-L-arabinonate dehydratase
VTRGLVPVLATPFRPDGGLDLESLRRLVEFQLKSGVDGVAVFGFASEGFALTATERAEILDAVRGTAGPSLPVVAGVGATGTAEAVAQARAATDGGASAVMVLPPHLVKPSAGQLVDFYGTVAAEGGLPVMVQDAPASTGVTMPVPLIAELSKLEGVESVKVEAQPTAPKLGAVVEAVAPPPAFASHPTSADFAVLGGQNAQFVLEEYARGAVGTMPACEFPDLLRPVLDAWAAGDRAAGDRAAGDRAAARAAFNRLLPLVRFGLQPGIAWSIHKHVLVRRGVISSPAVRPPAVDADPGTLAALDDILSDLALP